MDISTKIPESCCENALQEGHKIRKREGFLPQVPSVLSDGGILLQAKVQDSFNFVDRPQVELDAVGEIVLRFRCDCPDHRMNRLFCAHCAALVLAFEEERPALWFTVMDPEESWEAVHPAEAQKPGNADLPCVMDFSYAFCNSGEDLYPGIKQEKRRIPLKRYIQAFGDNARAIQYYKIMGTWGGSCFGISATASMLQQENEHTCIFDFSETAEIPSKLHLTDYNPATSMTLHQFIELVHILQLSRVVRREINYHFANQQCMEMLAERVEAFQQGEAGPVAMCVTGEQGGHAVLPYRLEKVSLTEDMLYIYDPNWPLVARYAYLEKDGYGNYLNWRFPMSDQIIYSGETGEKLAMASYENYKMAWDNRGDADSDNLLSVKVGVAVKNPEGVLLVRVTEAGVETYREDIYQIHVMGGATEDKVMISLPVGIYTLCLEDARQEELWASLTGLDIAVEIATTAREAVLRVEDAEMIAYVEVAQPNSSYSIEILNTFGEAHEEISLNGITGTERLQLVQKCGRLYANGLPQCSSLYINEKQQPLDRIGQLQEENTQPQRYSELVVNTEPDEKTKNAQN